MNIWENQRTESLELGTEATLKWSAKFLSEMLIEECAELIISIRHFDRKKQTKEDLFLELADVSILVEHMADWLDAGGGQFFSARRVKLERLKKRLNA